VIERSFFNKGSKHAWERKCLKLANFCTASFLPNKQEKGELMEGEEFFFH